ncbi:MAG: cation:proton antiporter, partial [Actinomycetota bacterium]|nr:cation:proton antiporter [Actinomycetota bacterium]
MSYGILALIVAVGLLGPLLAGLPTRVAPPVVIVEIVAGVVIGRTGTRTIDATQPTLAFLADVGFALLMFIVATRLPLRDARLRGAVGRGSWA